MGFYKKVGRENKAKAKNKEERLKQDKKMEKNKKKANEKIIFKVSSVFEGNLNTLHTSNILQQKFKQKYSKKREVLQC